MRQIQDKHLAELLMQLKFTPQDKRFRQLDALEELVTTISKDKLYPFEFIHFRITGFHLKHPMEPHVISGDQLLDDLRVFITKLSTKAAIDVLEAGEPVYDIESLAQKMSVSTKTVNRWRKRGLVARKCMFPDRVKRLGILQSSLDGFCEKHPDLVAKAQGFKRLETGQVEQMVNLARQFTQENISRFQVIERVAQETQRAHETVRYTLLQYEQEHAENPIFSKPAGVISPAEITRLYELYRGGTPIKKLMAEFGRSRSSIYRLINQRRATTLLARKVRFVHSDEFKDAQQRAHILSEDMGQQAQDVVRVFEQYDIMGEQLLPEYLQIIKATPVLSNEMELKLFRRYNCLKYIAHIARAGINLTRVSSARLKQAESYLSQAEDIERQIVEANLRLVVSIASRHSVSGPAFADLVSKGNYALIKAVQEFDYTTGFRFGKWASLSIAKEYAKVSGKSTELSRTKAASVGTMQQQLRDTTDIGVIERARHSLTEVIRNELDQREQFIILNHFGLIGAGIKKQTKTLKQIGDDLDLTKERVRQIELVALQKLRQCLSSEEFELLTT